MNEAILSIDVQTFLNENLRTDSTKIALSKSLFTEVSSGELAAQIVAKQKAEKKLPTWFSTAQIYYPPSLSIEQTSSEIAAKYKTELITGGNILDLTGGFGVDSYYFSKRSKKVIHCEIDRNLSKVAKQNATVLNAKNIEFVNTDGIEFLKSSTDNWDTIYVDPARRSNSGKVFRLEDCTPNILINLDLLLSKCNRLLIKTSPLLDIDAGLKVLTNVKEVHVVSIKNECKELLWILEKGFVGDLKIIPVALNETEKSFSFFKDQMFKATHAEDVILGSFLYEPDVAVLKSGGQDLIANHFNLQKLETSTQLYVSNKLEKSFIGRIFLINGILDAKNLKKSKKLQGNVIVRNYPAKAEKLIEKYKISSTKDDFLIFCKFANENIIISATILQYY